MEVEIYHAKLKICLWAKIKCVAVRKSSYNSMYFVPIGQWFKSYRILLTFLIPYFYLIYNLLNVPKILFLKVLNEIQTVNFAPFFLESKLPWRCTNDYDFNYRCTINVKITVHINSYSVACKFAVWSCVNAMIVPSVFSNVYIWDFEYIDEFSLLKNSAQQLQYISAEY